MGLERDNISIFFHRNCVHYEVEVEDVVADGNGFVAYLVQTPGSAAIAGAGTSRVTCRHN